MAKPTLSLFTQPHSRGRKGSKYGDFFREMKMEEIKLLPPDLQEKQSVKAYVPADIRDEFVFRTSPDDGKRYVARLPRDRQPTINRKPRTNASQSPQNARSAAKEAVVASESTEASEKDSRPSQKAAASGRMEPPKPFDAAD